MQAQELLKRYAAGERDFKNINLRGQSLQGQNLSGADFSGADICGANFTGANLRKTCFYGAHAGIQKRWIIFEFLIIFLLTVLSGFLSGFTSGTIGQLIIINGLNYYMAAIAGILVIILTLALVISIMRRGFTSSTFLFFLVISICATMILLLINKFLFLSLEMFHKTYFANAFLAQTFNDIQDGLTSDDLFIQGDKLSDWTVRSEIVIQVVGIIFPFLITSVTATIAVGTSVAILIEIFIMRIASRAIVAVVALLLFVCTLVGIPYGLFESSPMFYVARSIVSKFGIHPSQNMIDLMMFNSPSLTYSFILSILILCSVFLLGFYLVKKSLKVDQKFTDDVQKAVIFFESIVGTHFCNADISEANFSKASLRGANFCSAKLKQVYWKEAKFLDRARVGDSILADWKVLTLLITLNGYQKNYENADLRGANLAGAMLEKATLKHADLSQAILRNAHLKEANLTEALCVEADFSRAYLTGACLQGWNIDHHTKLEGIDCQYIFLLEQPNANGHCERRPHETDRVFAKGEFEALYTKMMDVVQVLLKNGMNGTAFSFAFQKFIAEHPEYNYDSIQAIERKGNDALVTLAVSENADKAEISRSLREAYETKLNQLEAEIKELNRLRPADLNDIAMIRYPIFNQFGGANPVQENIDHSQKISIGGDFILKAKDSVVSLRDITGNVTNAINQLPDRTDPHQPNLKDHLTELQQSIEAEPTLSEADKVDLLEETQHLAQAAQTQDPTQKDSLIRKAKKMFDGTLKHLPDSAKLIEACSRLLPLILKALGFHIP